MQASQSPLRASGMPRKQGLYDPGNEKDSCGVGFLCHLKGQKSRSIIEGALEMCVNMDHRGGCGCDANTGDGAGIFFQLPHKFFETVSAGIGIELPEEGRYAVGFLYLSPEQDACSRAMSIFEGIVNEEGQVVLGWRDVPVKSEILGDDSRACEPLMKQIFIGRSDDIENDQD